MISLLPQSGLLPLALASSSAIEPQNAAQLDTMSQAGGCS